MGVFWLFSWGWGVGGWGVWRVSPPPLQLAQINTPLIYIHIYYIYQPPRDKLADLVSTPRREAPKPLFENFVLDSREASVCSGVISCVFCASGAQPLQQKKTLTQKSTVASIKNGKMPATFRKSKEIQWILQIFANFANFANFT